MGAAGPTVAPIRETVGQEGLLAGDGPVVAMLSGGRDSVCLLDVAVALCGAERVRALHVNYGLRTESDGDERHCRELCERVGVGIEVVRARRGADEGGNLHAWAREVRYGAAFELAERLDGGPQVGSAAAGQAGRTAPRGDQARVAAGHTATDQVETILYRLAASPGRRALLGMSGHEGRLVRPLLGITREQTAAYCRERGLEWREDAGNDDPSYARARVRHGLLPAFEKVHPGALSNVLRTAALLREETELLEGLVDVELDGRHSIEIERLRALPCAMQRLVVVRLAEQASGVLVPQAGERVQEILELACRRGRAELHIGRLSAAIIESGILHMVSIAPRPQRPPRNSVGSETD